MLSQNTQVAGPRCGLGGGRGHVVGIDLASAQLRVQNLRDFRLGESQEGEIEVGMLQLAEFDRDARIRHDIRTRYDVYRVARDIGLLNVDEVRELEDREPLPKPKTDADYDGKDYTPLLIQVAAARGLATELGTGPETAPNPESAKTALPGTPLPPVKVPVAASNGNGQHA